jgi:hypothetical protein
MRGGILKNGTETGEYMSFKGKNGKGGFEKNVLKNCIEIPF